MSASSKSTRFPAQFIPSFLALEASDSEQTPAELPAAQSEPPVPVLIRRMQVDARLELGDAENGECKFILHSRMNARIFTGVLAAALTSDRERLEATRGLLTKCTQESSFELLQVDGSFVWSLLPNALGAQGQSDKMVDEALARATLRLITGQAARALRSHELT